MADELRKCAGVRACVRASVRPPRARAPLRPRLRADCVTFRAFLPVPFQPAC